MKEGGPMNEELPYLPLILFCIAFTLQASSRQGATKPTPDEVEKVHSHLFHKAPEGEIPNELASTTGDVHIVCVVPIMQRIWVPFVDDLAMLASKSDLIVVGKAGNSTSHMNDDKDFLYSDWTFTVEEVLKDNPAASAQPGASILVTRPGGKLQINGRMVYANCADFREYISGQEYLLYLGFIPETGAYANHGTAAFSLSQVRRLDEVNYQREAPDKDTLLKTAREAVLLSTKIPRS